MALSIIIIQTNMKSKKNRKHVRDPSPVLDLPQKSNNKNFQVKFDVLKNDISCFFNKTHSSSQPSITNMHSKQFSSKRRTLPHQPQTKQVYVQHKQKNEERGSSVDLIKESSNIILFKIQQKGIKCDWNQEADNEASLNKKEQFEEPDNIWSAFDTSFEKSYASTTDYTVFQNKTTYWENVKQPQQLSQNSYSIQLSDICLDWRTTLMIRNIPNKYTVSQLALQIDSEHSDTYDFLYLPCDLRNQCNVGYGFINMVNTKHLQSFYQKFNRYTWRKYRSEKICSLTYARLQGLNQLIQHFSNSKVLNQKQKKYRPIIKLAEIQKMVLEQQKK